MSKSRVNWFHANLVSLFACAAALVYMFTYLSDCFGPPIRADGEGYYAYLPSYIIHRDPSFSTWVSQRFPKQVADWTGLRLCAETGRYQNKFSAGVAVMILPFFIVAHVLTWCMNPLPGSWDWLRFRYALDGYSLFYQHAAGLAGMVYTLLGIVILKRHLDRYFSPGVVAAGLSVLFFGTNLLHYSSGETVLSHPYSFFLTSCLLYLVPQFYEQPLSYARSTLLGGILGLALWVRLTNIVLLLPLAFYGVFKASDIRGRVEWLRSNSARVLWTAAVALLVYAPQLVMNRYAVGKWYVNAYAQQGYGFNFVAPAWTGVLFSPKAGLLFWSPALVLCVPGFVALRGEARKWLVPIWVYTSLQVYVIASWFMWWFGGGFGHRGFVESYALLAIPLCATLAVLKSRSARVVIGILAFLLIAYSLFMMKLYYTREISYYGLDDQALFDMLWVRKMYWNAVLKKIVGLF